MELFSVALNPFVGRQLFQPNTTTALLLAEDRKSKKRRRSDRIWAVHAVPWLFKMRFRTLIFSGKTADS